MVGAHAAVLVDVILRSRPHPEQGFRSCIGILGLVKRFGTARVDAACARALVLGTRSYNSVATILKNHRENVPAADGGGACSDPREHPRGPMSIIYIHGVTPRGQKSHADQYESLHQAIKAEAAQLNPAKDVQGNVDEAVDHVRAILRRFDEINNRLGEITDSLEMEKLLPYTGTEFLGSLDDGREVWI